MTKEFLVGKIESLLQELNQAAAELSIILQDSLEEELEKVIQEDKEKENG